jgi:hypothetical protein
VRLLHYSTDAIAEVRSVPQNDERFKPKGLWVSVEGEQDWKSWCESENFADLSRQMEYRVILSDEANILYLRDAYDIDRFTGKYRLGTYRVDWAAVAAKYDGIVIAPYCWDRRLDYSSDWYYPWDCASGCIWNARAVAALELQAQSGGDGSQTQGMVSMGGKL